MKLVAVLVDDNCDTSSWLNNGIIKIYSYSENQWINSKNIYYDISMNLNSIILENYLCELVEKELINCRIFVGKDISGLLFNLLDNHNFNIYEIDGKPYKFLDYLLIAEDNIQSEKLISKNNFETELFPRELDNLGNYIINLKEILSDETITSKKILKPFLKKRNFKSLEIIFDHVPKWFENELSKIGYRFNVISNEAGIIKIFIYPNLNNN